MAMEPENSASGVASGRPSPFRVWMTATILVRIAQLIAVGCIIWAIVALFDAFDQSARVHLPPWWLALPAFLVGTSSPNGHRRWQDDTLGGMVAHRLSAPACPDCGQDIFDQTGPTGYASWADRQGWWPSKTCANCGHDLRLAI